MKPTIPIILILCALCSPSFAAIHMFLEAPQDELKARSGIRERPELKGLATEYKELQKNHFLPLKLVNMAQVFGPKLEKRPDDRTLPLFVPTGLGLSGLRYTDPTKNKDHIDFHAIADFAYVELYYQIDGESIAACVFYFRADDKFVPLRSADDFPKRLEWDNTKFEALKTWFAAHLPQE
jgi:hypothetical protein